MEFYINLFSEDLNDEFDIVEFYIDLNTAIISLKNSGKKDDIKCINVELADLKKLAKIINDINL